MLGAQLEITRGGARAVINEVGASLRLYTVDGQAYTETYAADAEKPPASAGAVLVPWPNRVANGRWGHGQLEITEPARGNAIHGLVRSERWTVLAHEASQVRLECIVHNRSGWPFPFRTTVSYALDERGLTVEHTMHNTGERDMPFGVGTHPYLRVPDADVDDCTLRLAAHTHLPLDPDRMIPSGEPAAIDSELRAGAPLRGREFDDAFGDCEPDQDGWVRHELTGPHGRGVALVADPAWRWVQVYTAAEFPGRPGRAVAIEPMTCPPDALNSGTDLRSLEPGQAWTGRWGVRPVN